jgi:transposase
MDGFFAFLGERSSKRVRLAVMDMWKPFRKSTNKKAPQAAILFDKFHILMHLETRLTR